MAIFVIATLFAVITGTIASGKKRSAFGWGALGFFFPVVALVAICCVPDREWVEQVTASTSSRQPPTGV